MVFYGKKRSELENQTEQYHSIKEQILKQLGERITPVYQKSLATIFADVGDVVLIATQQIMSLPQKFKTTMLYSAYQEDRKNFKVQMEPNVQWYQSLPKRISENKFYLIKNYSCQSRIFTLNALVFLMGIASLRANKGFGQNLRNLMKTCVVGYPLGGIFIVPEIYNSIILPKKII